MLNPLNLLDVIAIVIAAFFALTIIYGLIANAWHSKEELKAFIFGVVIIAMALWAGIRVISLFN